MPKVNPKNIQVRYLFTVVRFTEKSQISEWVTVCEMAGTTNYEDFQRFLKKFTAAIDPDDQLPIRVSNYTITKDEFQPEVVNFARQYLQDKWVNRGWGIGHWPEEEVVEI